MKEIDFSKLKEPFDARDIEWRLQSAGETNGKVWGKVLAYVTNRAIQTRLDEVCGPENWRNEFIAGPNGGILCGISIKCNGEWITKWDGAENTQIEAVKGGLSDSMKRSAVQWSIGRYLYNLEEGWAVVSEKGAYSGKTKEGKWFKWDPPALPSWALPKGSKKMSDSVTTTTSAESDSPELTQSIQTVTSYINKGQLNKSWVPTAQNYIASKDIDGLKRVIKYVEDQIAKEVEKEAASA